MLYISAQKQKIIGGGGGITQWRFPLIRNSGERLATVGHSAGRL
jgi:hypothetical protein